MNEDKPFIHLFRTRGGYYIYDVNTNLILKVSGEVYNLLYKNDLNEINRNRDIGKMLDRNFLSSKRLSEMAHPVDDILPYYLNNKLCMITLQVTQQCNFRCEYCSYSGNYLNRSHSNKKMTFETAKKGIDFLICHSTDANKISIAFYGGEPLLEIELIRKCIEYAEERTDGKETGFNITTNGSLITEEIIEYFEKHNVSLMISLDGPKEVHDKNRIFAGSNCGSFDKVMANLEKIKDKYPAYFAKIFFNVVMDTENDFSCINDFFTNYETIKDSDNVNSTFISDMYIKSDYKIKEDFSIKRNYELFKILLSMTNRLDGRYVSKLVKQYYLRIKRVMHDDRKPTKMLGSKGYHGGPCIPGEQRLFMDVNGSFYPCERVSEDSEVMCIGNIDVGFDIEKVRQLLNIGKISEETCKDCWAFRYCILCAASADVLTHLSPEFKLSQCDNVRRIVENEFIDYCTLGEFGHNFERENKIISIS